MDALLFGSIGTLADTSALQLEAYNVAFREQGLDWHWSVDEYRRLLLEPGGKARLRRHAAQQGETPPDDLIDAVHARKTDLFNDWIVEGRASLRPGVVRLVQEARVARQRVALVTTTERRSIETLLGAAGDVMTLSDFDVVIDRTRVERGKPDPEAWLLAAKELGVNPERCIAIEATAVCVGSAVAAGALCVASPNHFARDSDFSMAVAVVSNLGDATHDAAQLSGAKIVDHGMVTLRSLADLVVERALEREPG